MGYDKTPDIILEVPIGEQLHLINLSPNKDLIIMKNYNFIFKL